MNPYDHIDDFKAGKLSGKELRKFEVALETDKQLARQVENYDVLKTASEGILELQLLEEVKNATGQSTYGENRNTRFGNGETHPIFYWLALLVTIVFVIYYLFNPISPGDEPGPMAFAEVYIEPLWEVSRKTDVDIISEASSKYLNGKFKAAKNQLLSISSTSDEANYWLAEMHLQHEEPDSVLNYLPEFDISNQKYERSKYVEAMAYYLLGQKSRAREVINTLPKGRYERLKAVLNQEE